jgi:hypothetical protein
MFGTHLSRWLRGASIAGLSAALVALGGTGALAAHQAGSSGMPGPYSWTDTSSEPAGLCDYEGGGTAGHTYIVRVKVSAPTTVLWPHDASSNAGTVGFKVKLQHLSGGTWHHVNTGSEATSTATEDSSAAFGPRSVYWAGPNTGRDRAVAVLTWYNPDMSILGRVSVVIDHYRNNHDHVRRSYCPVVYRNL